MMEPTFDISRKQNRMQLRWEPIDHFLRYGLPSPVMMSLRMMWSNQYGSDDEIVSNQAGTDISNTGSYISQLMNTSMMDYYQLFSTFESIGTLFGVVRRLTDLLRVLDEVNPQVGSAAQQQADLSLVVPRAVSGIDRGSGPASSLVVEACDIVTPRTNSCLAKGLSFTVDQGGEGGHLAVICPSGAGKTALCRVLGGLWSVPAGTVTLPTAVKGRSALYIVPQKPLILTAPVSLRELVTYPVLLDQAEWEAAEPGLARDLTTLKVIELVEREGWVTAKLWHQLLSMGELQSLAMVRLLFHQPRLVILDDCLSGVGEDINAIIYQLFEDRSIRVVTCAQSLSAASLRYHGRELRLGQSTPSGWSEHQISPPPVSPHLERDIDADKKEEPADGPA